MRAVLLEVDPAALEARRRAGLDRWDEMWEGVLHLAPAPYSEHQRILEDLIVFLKPLLARTGRGVLRAGINVFNEASIEPDYRIPDLTFVARGRELLIAKDGIRGGGPDAVIEIRSPQDETYEKLAFFATLGVREVIVIDRDSKRTEIFRLQERVYSTDIADAKGGLTSQTMNVRFAVVAGSPPRLVVQDTADPSTSTEI